MQSNDAAVRTGAWTWLSWAALAIALSPVIADAARLAIDTWWARGSVLMAALAVCCMFRSERTGVRRPGLGAALIAIALVASLVAAGGGMLRLARPAIPLAAIGMASFLGRPGALSAGLLVFAVAPPRALMDALPGLHDWVGPRPIVEAPDGGLPLAWLLAGLGAFAGVRLGEGATRVIVRALRHALLAIPIQLGALLVAGRLWQAGYPDAARGLLSHGVWTLSAGALLLHIHRREGGASRLERQ